MAAIIAPWNFPLQLTLIPALAAAAVGNTVLLKPSEKLPLLSKRIAALIEEAGFPAGVIQLIEGGKSEAERLIDARPDKLWFTGSEAAGRSVLARAGALLIPCVLELGGKDPLIVCADAHVERAARAAVWGAFYTAAKYVLVWNGFTYTKVFMRLFWLRSSLIRRSSGRRVAVPGQS